MANSNSVSTPPTKSLASVFTLLVATIALLTAALALGWLWQTENRSGRIEQERNQVIDQIKLLDERLKVTENDLRTTRSRLQDAAALNRNLRDEILAMAERAQLLETAVKRVSDHGIDNVAELKFNNAELLMTAGLARLRLFRDSAGAGAALQWADAELATLHEPIVTSIRQSLAHEITALSAIPASQRSSALASLHRLHELVAVLPVRNPNPPLPETKQEPNIGSRLRALLGDFIRVRRLDADAPGLIRPLQVELARAQLRLQLLDLETIVIAGDDQRLQTLCTHFENTAKTHFELQSDSGKALLLDVQTLRALPTLPALETVGSALSQLRNRKNAQQLAQPTNVTE